LVTPTSTADNSSNDSLRVLFVDDQPDLRALMQVMLARRSYAVATAGEARDALQIAPDFKPHIVVSDIGCLA
jgi:DNA-binding NtrC family response regulator